MNDEIKIEDIPPSESFMEIMKIREDLFQAILRQHLVPAHLLEPHRHDPVILVGVWTRMGEIEGFS